MKQALNPEDSWLAQLQSSHFWACCVSWPAGSTLFHKAQSWARTMVSFLSKHPWALNASQHGGSSQLNTSLSSLHLTTYVSDAFCIMSSPYRSNRKPNISKIMQIPLGSTLHINCKLFTTTVLITVLLRFEMWMIS